MTGFGVRRVGHVRINEDEHLVLSGEQFTGVDFSGRRLVQFSAEGCRFERCRFDNVAFESASFGAGRRMSEYVGCSFDGSKLRMVPGGYARFVGCSFDRTTIEHWFCFAVELIDCTFSGRLQKVVFNGSVRPEDQGDVGRSVNQFEGNDFAQAKLVDVSFRTGIDLSKQRLPAGDEYAYIDDAAAAVRRARVAYNAWDDAEAKKRARGVLAVMEDDVAAGQEQLLIRPDDYPKAARPAIRLLLDAARTP